MAQSKADVKKEVTLESLNEELQGFFKRLETAEKNTKTNAGNLECFCCVVAIACIIGFSCFAGVVIGLNAHETRITKSLDFIVDLRDDVNAQNKYLVAQMTSPCPLGNTVCEFKRLQMIGSADEYLVSLPDYHEHKQSSAAA